MVQASQQSYWTIPGKSRLINPRDHARMVTASLQKTIKFVFFDKDFGDTLLGFVGTGGFSFRAPEMYCLAGKGAVPSKRFLLASNGLSFRSSQSSPCPDSWIVCCLSKSVFIRSSDASILAAGISCTCSWAVQVVGVQRRCGPSTGAGCCPQLWHLVSLPHMHRLQDHKPFLVEHILSVHWGRRGMSQYPG